MISTVQTGAERTSRGVAVVSAGSGQEAARARNVGVDPELARVCLAELRALAASRSWS